MIFDEQKWRRNKQKEVRAICKRIEESPTPRAEMIAMLAGITVEKLNELGGVEEFDE